MKFLKQIFHTTRRVVAKYWLSKIHVTQIAITGSQGKTAVSQGLYKMLETLRPVVVTDVNLDTIYNVPITAIHVRPYHQYAIFELGIDHLKEMDFHLDIVKPGIAVITGVSPVHSDEAHMKSFDNVIIEKRKLIEALSSDGVAILNYSDENIRTMAKHTKAKVVWYGKNEDFIARHPVEQQDPEVNSNHWMPASAGMKETKEGLTTKNYISYSNIKVTTEGTEFDLFDNLNISKNPPNPDSGQARVTGGNTKNDSKKIHIKTKLIGTFHASNICAIYCILKSLNPYFVNNFDVGVAELLTPLPGRMNIEEGPNKTIVLNDSLRANPISTSAGLETFSKIEYKSGRKVAILADMGELEKPSEEHKKIGKLLAKLPIDVVVCAGKWQKFVAMEARKNHKLEVHYFDTVDDAKGDIFKIIKPKDFVYLKGSKYSYVGKILGS
ncbi:MAG: Mur ligase family protein [Patescibacteria group bacterium]